METVEITTELFEELEGHVDPRERRLQGIALGLPRADHRAGAEGIAAGAPHRVPVGNGEAEVVPHRLAFDERVGVVMPEGQHVLRRRALVLDPADARKRLSVCHVSLLVVVESRLRK